MYDGGASVDPKEMKKLVIVCWLFGAAPALSQTPLNATHPIPTGKISWSDFTGSAEPGSPYWARTEWRVTYKYKYKPWRPYSDTVKVDLDVQPLLKNTSWVIPNRQGDELLLHEQGHFNFALLLAARFKKAADAAVFTKVDHEQKLQVLFTQSLLDVKQLEEQYDSETNHMRNKIAQLAWNLKMEAWLKAAQ